MRLWLTCFPVSFVKFRRTPFLQNTSGRLLLSTYAKVLKDIHIKKMFIIITVIGLKVKKMELTKTKKGQRSHLRKGFIYILQN